MLALDNAFFSPQRTQGRAQRTQGFIVNLCVLPCVLCGEKKLFKLRLLIFDQYQITGKHENLSRSLIHPVFFYSTLFL